MSKQIGLRAEMQIIIAKISTHYAANALLNRPSHRALHARHALTKLLVVFSKQNRLATGAQKQQSPHILQKLPQDAII